jgi:hypothetical protein
LLEHDLDLTRLPRLDPTDQPQCASLEADAEEAAKQGI